RDVTRQRQEEVQKELEEDRRNTVQPGDKVFVKVFRRKWYNERRDGPFEVVRSTGTAVQVKGSPTWYHLSHCVKAPTEEGPRVEREDGDRGEQEEGEIVNVGINVDNDDTSDYARDDYAGGGKEGGFGEIDFQYVPEATGNISAGCEASNITKGNSVKGEASDSVGQNRPRPVR
ncbi:hypothetical protein J4Q44_G00293110, partial [Coregonus suidteri]